MKVNQMKVLIVDDHQMVRDGIRVMLNSQSKRYNFVLSEAETGEQGLDMAKRNEYDIILMDYSLPAMNGAQAVYQIRLYKPDAKILAVSNHQEYTVVKNILDSGAQGYILKNVGPAKLVSAMEAIISGKNYYSRDIANLLINKSNIENCILGTTQLTEREIEIMTLIAEEYNNREIAEKLNIEKRTVEAHRYNLQKKLCAKNTAGLLKLAFKYNLVSIRPV